MAYFFHYRGTQATVLRQSVSSSPSLSLALLNGWSEWPSQLQASSNAGTMSITVSLWWRVPKLMSHSCDKTTHNSNPVNFSNPRELPVISEIYWTVLVLCRVLYSRSTNPFIWGNTPTLDIRALIYTTKVWNLLYFTWLLHSISSTLFSNRVSC